MREALSEIEEIEAELEVIESIHGSRPFDEMPAETQERHRKLFARWEELFFESLAEAA